MTINRHDATVASPAVDLDVDDAAVEQDVAPPLGALPVVVETPVRTQQLPARAAGYRRVTVGTTEPLRVLGRDPRRRRVLVQVYDATGTTHGAFYGTTRNEVTPPAAFAARLGVTLPAGGIPVASPVIELTSMDELWVLADTAACDVTVAAEQWAD